MDRKMVVMAVTSTFQYDGRVQREATTLVQNGYEVKVICLKTGSLSQHDFFNGVEIIRIIPQTWAEAKKNPVRIYQYFRKIFSVGTSTQYALYKELLKQKADVFHAHDLDTLKPIFLAAKQHGARVVYDSHELFIDTLTEFSSVGKIIHFLLFRLAAFYYTYIEKKYISKVSVIITVSDAMSKIFEKRYFLTEKPKVIRNLPYPYSSNKTDFIRGYLKLKPTDKIIINQGVLGPGRGLLPLVESVKYLPNYCHLVFIGGGSWKDILIESACKINKSSQIHFIDYLSTDTLLEYTSSADVGVVLLENLSLNESVALPNKFFEYIMAGIPIVCSGQIEMKKIIDKYHIGIVLDRIMPQTIYSAILETFTIQTSKDFRKNNSQVKTIFNWQVEQMKLLDVYKEL